MAQDVTSVCESCGASIYKEHLDSGIARYEGGKLLCTHCVSEYERAHDGTVGAGDDDDMLKPIAFADDEESDSGGGDEEELSSSRIQVASGSILGGGSGKWDDEHLKRKLDPTSIGASRCRMFHSKLNEGAIEFMTTNINEWLESSPNVVVKFASSTIGVFEGKHAEPNLILTLFY